MMRADLDWPHFVAIALFLAMSFTWIQFRRGRSPAVTALGMIGFLVALWVVLRVWP